MQSVADRTIGCTAAFLSCIDRFTVGWFGSMLGLAAMPMSRVRPISGAKAMVIPLPRSKSNRNGAGEDRKICSDRGSDVDGRTCELSRTHRELDLECGGA